MTVCARLFSFTLAALLVAPASVRGSAGIPPGAGAAGAAVPDPSRRLEAFGRLPLRFEANQGQSDAGVRFLSRGRGHTLFLAGDETVLAAHGATVRMRLAGGNPFPGIEGLDLLPGESHYLIGSDPRAWRTHVPAYARVRYREVYPGIARRPEVLRSASELAAFETGDIRPSDFHMMASHLFGTACAGSDPRHSVVGPDLQSHALPGLYVMDASVFPTNLGVNPQHSIMALVWRAAERLANAAKLPQRHANASRGTLAG